MELGKTIGFDIADMVRRGRGSPSAPFAVRFPTQERIQKTRIIRSEKIGGVS
jgi:hypothetical protein